MLELDEKFFEEEVRCDFTVPAMMKKVWAAEMKVLKEIILICEKYGLTYYADCGTLLGAVRHHGFIPWDDDIDISLKREDYQKLMQVLPKELGSNYRVNSIYTSNDHNALIATVTNYESVPLPEDVKNEFYGCPYVVGVDIYALDYLPRDEEMANVQLSLYNAVYDLAYRYEEIKVMGDLEKYLKQVEELCAVQLERNDDTRHKLWLLCDRIGSLVQPEESDRLTFYPRRVMGDLRYVFAKDWYARAIKVPFENMEINVPQNYHAALTQMYGDYSQIVFGPSGHDYPFYKTQEQYLKSLNLL